jgi:class 3 adenylate cyclase
MSLHADLDDEITKILGYRWSTEDARVVPAPDNVALGDGQAKHLASATVLYADIDGSTNMVDTEPWWFCAEVYKAYLACAARIIRFNGGEITAYDGDRIMAVFIGDSKNTAATRAAMTINWAVHDLLRPRFAHYQKSYVLRHVVGVDTSPLHATRIGVRGYNDLVWIGRAANHAAKMTTDAEFGVWISDDVYSAIAAEVKIHNGLDMWQPRAWPEMSNRLKYGTTYMFQYPR